MQKLFLLLFLFHSQQAFSQLYISGQSTDVCPGESMPYLSHPPLSEGCTFKWTVTNGVFTANGSSTIEGFGLLNVDVTWNSVIATSNTSAPFGRLRIERNCTENVSGDAVFVNTGNIYIKTLNNVTPGNITGQISVNQGITGNISYSIQTVLFPNTGQTGLDPSERFATNYQWVLPSGWKIGTITSDGITPITGQSNSIAATPHGCNGNNAKIRVRAFSNCGNGYTSNWREITISRPLPTLSFSAPPPASVVCGNTTPITVTVTPVPGATSYTWTKPSGWGGTSTTNSITLTPNATGAGDVTVRASLCSAQTAVLSRTITRSLFDPSNPPTVSGADLLCTTNFSYAIQNLPAGATATWAVSPTGLFGGALSGSGTSASIRALNSFSTSGLGKVIFTINTLCGGSFQIERQMWVGVPTDNSSILLVQPNYTPICTNESTYFNAFYNNYVAGNSESNITYYDWIPPITGCYSVGNKNQVLICNFDSDGYYTFRVRAQNACGYGGWRWVYPFVTSCYYFAVNINPNPADDFIRIELVETPVERNVANLDDNSMDQVSTKNSELSFINLDYEIKIYDTGGYLMKSIKSKEINQELDVSSLKPGRYFVHIEHPDGVVKRQILIN